MLTRYTSNQIIRHFIDTSIIFTNIVYISVDRIPSFMVNCQTARQRLCASTFRLYTQLCFVKNKFFKKIQNINNLIISEKAYPKIEKLSKTYFFQVSKKFKTFFNIRYRKFQQFGLLFSHQMQFLLLIRFFLIILIFVIPSLPTEFSTKIFPQKI